MSLAQAIQAAQQKNEEKLAAQVSVPQLRVDTESILHMRHFAEWCKERGVRYLPAYPTTIALYVRGSDSDNIVDALAAIDAMHQHYGLPNPVATNLVRSELQKALMIEPPRWNKQEQLIFCGLPPDVQAIISRHSKLDSNAVRKAQNEAAELRKKLKAFEKGNTDNAELQKAE